MQGFCGYKVPLIQVLLYAETFDSCVTAWTFINIAPRLDWDTLAPGIFCEIKRFKSSLIYVALHCFNGNFGF
jgi:hypothetical protein